eukprot:363477-Chlamydomonas_euryale.AAC.5
MDWNVGWRSGLEDWLVVKTNPTPNPNLHPTSSPPCHPQSPLALQCLLDGFFDNPDCRVVTNLPGWQLLHLNDVAGVNADAACVECVGALGGTAGGVAAPAFMCEQACMNPYTMRSATQQAACSACLLRKAGAGAAAGGDVSGCEQCVQVRAKGCVRGWQVWMAGVQGASSACRHSKKDMCEGGRCGWQVCGCGQGRWISSVCTCVCEGGHWRQVWGCRWQVESASSGWRDALGVNACG